MPPLIGGIFFEYRTQKAFNFLCLGHLEISEALGFKTYQATTVLRLVKENEIVQECSDYLCNMQ